MVRGLSKKRQLDQHYLLTEKPFQNATTFFHILNIILQRTLLIVRCYFYLAKNVREQNVQENNRTNK